MDRPRLTRDLAVVAIATYALLVTGVTLAAGLPLTVHMGAAGINWVFVLVVWRRATRSHRTRKITLPMTAAVAVYPLQAAVGMLGLVGPSLAGLHLVGAMLVFALLLVSLIGSAETDRPDTAEPEWTLAASGAVPNGNADPGLQRDPPGSHDPPSKPSPSHLTILRAYLALTKPRLMWLLCLLALAGMGLAMLDGADPDGGIVVATIAGGVLAIGASGTFNHVIEVERDRTMDRTADRPLVTGLIDRSRAAIFGFVLAGLSLVVMTVFVNPFAMWLTAAAILYYSVLYTVILKPNTTWNIAVGGGAGALPAVIGWAAATGGIGPPAIVLAGLVVMWTPAHFYNLAIANRDEYARASFPMLPVVRGPRVARRRIVLTMGATFILAALLAPTGGLGPLYGVATIAVAGLFLWSIVRQYDERTAAAAYRSFYVSNAYLGGLLVAIVIEAMLW